MMSPRRPSIALLGALIICACAEPPASPGVLRSAIINGQPSREGDHPSAGAILAYVQTFGGPQGGVGCSGTLIAPDVVLTAGHCTEGPPGTRSITFLFSLALDVNGFQAPEFRLPERTVEVTGFATHPGWLGAQLANAPQGLGEVNDIALMFLAAPIEDVEPAVLADMEGAGVLVTGTEVLIAGYGQRTPQMPQPGRPPPPGGIKYQAVSVVGDVARAEMQIGTVEPMPQKCHGDSGGPTYLDFDDDRVPARRVIGVTSRGYNSDEDCTVGGVDTRVDHHWAWISETMIRACERRDRVSCDRDGAPTVPTAEAPNLGWPDVGDDFPDVGEPPWRWTDSGVPPEVDASLDSAPPMLDAVPPASDAHREPTPDPPCPCEGNDRQDATVCNASAATGGGDGGCRTVPGTGTGPGWPLWLGVGVVWVWRRRSTAWQRTDDAGDLGGSK